MSTLQLTVRQAILNKSYDIMGKMENYVYVKFSNGLGETSEYRTDIVDGEKDKPIVWNQTINIPTKQNGTALLEFEVRDEDVTTHDVCGKGKVKLANCGIFTKNATQNFSLRMFDTKNSEISGTLSFTTRFV